MTTNLKDINFGLNQYCGPSVLSALTGKSTDECASVISSISGKREIKAVEIHHLIKAFEKLRFNCVKINCNFAYSLFGVLSNLVSNNGCYIVLVPRHVVAVEVIDNKIWLIDNHSKSPLPAEGSARLSQRVEGVYKVTAKAQPVFVKNEYDVVAWCGSITITKTSVYENHEDNVEFKMGHFYYKDHEELRQVVNKINNLEILL